MITILEATQNLLEQHHSGIGVFIKGEINESEKLKGVTFVDGSELLFTFEDVLLRKAALQGEFDAQEYARNRQAEYPAIEDQLDEIYHNGINSWKAVIKVTKDKYPKG